MTTGPASSRAFTSAGESRKHSRARAMTAKRLTPQFLTRTPKEAAIVASPHRRSKIVLRPRVFLFEAPQGGQREITLILLGPLVAVVDWLAVAKLLLERFDQGTHLL